LVDRDLGRGGADVDPVLGIRDGPGIPAEDQPHLFYRFWQAQRAQRAGAGLGLAIVKGIVEVHGGDIHVESEVGRGSTFVFRLPALPRSARRPDLEGSAGHAPPP
jgi:signal transduction histidine kinase